MTADNTFVPVLTVMPDYGNAPFLWVVREPDQGGIGGNLVDGCYWDESFPMSEGLWRKFADWAIEFDRTEFYFEHPDDWDWIAYHQRGLLLSRWLKDEVKDSFRVVYHKPVEDPNQCIDFRREMLADGTVLLHPYDYAWSPNLRVICRLIVSGGQAGADRAALDFAIEGWHYSHGGWAPKDRQAEDGPIPLKYQLTELPEGGYRQRTRRNVEDSDGTLIVNLGELEGGSLATQEYAQQQGKPNLVVQMDPGVTIEAVDTVLAWLRKHVIDKLNVAGPRESKRPGIYRLTLDLLDATDKANRDQLSARPPKRSSRK